MKKTFTTSLFAGGLLLTDSTARAQVSFSIGPKVGCNRFFSPFEYPNQDYLTVTNASRNVVEAGLMAQISFSNHWAVQPAVLYVQKG